MVPFTCDDQFCVPATRVTRLPTTGATAFSAGTCCCDGLDIGQLEVRRAGAVAARAELLARPQHQQVAAEAGDLVGDHARGAVAQRHHGDHRADADDDAEHGQERAHQVAADRAQGEQQGVQAASGSCRLPCRASLSTLPSTKCTMRLA